MKNSTSWYAVAIIGSDFLFSSFISESLISPPLCYPSSSPPPQQKESFIVLATLQYCHYHLPPHPPFITWLKTDVGVIKEEMEQTGRSSTVSQLFILMVFSWAALCRWTFSIPPTALLLNTEADSSLSLFTFPEKKVNASPVECTLHQCFVAFISVLSHSSFLSLMGRETHHAPQLRTHTHAHNGIVSLPLSAAGAGGGLMGEGNIFPFLNRKERKGWECVWVCMCMCPGAV